MATRRARPKGGKAPVFADGSTLAEAALRALRAPAPGVAARETADEIVRLSADAEQASSRLTHYRAALRRAGAPPSVVDAAKRPELTTAANQRRFDRFGAPGGPAQAGLAPPPAWAFEAVRARLARADPSRPAAKRDVLDVMIALAARPAELARLEIGADGSVRGFAKARGAAGRPYAGMLDRERAAALLGWVQAAIRRGELPDPGTPGSKP
ncbi:MAG TPA: hypothetical protein VNI01_14045, partial [Elusimicrobiota bacterium]|nr:hypothetical protein [Elusimicrobiota bacterium]